MSYYELGVGKEVSKNRGRVALRGDVGKDDSGSYAVFIEQGSFASHTTAAKVLDVISRLPDCVGEACDAVSLHTSENEGRSRFIEIAKVSMSIHLDTSTTFSMFCATTTQIFSDIHWQDTVGATFQTHLDSKTSGRKYLDGNADA